MAAGRHAAVVRCASPDEMVSLAAAFAPEHLSLQGAVAESLRDSVRNAGAVFVGSMSPVSIGDYVAGPNHTLPTQGAARYRGPLAVMDFIRWPSVVQLSGRGVRRAGAGGDLPCRGGGSGGARGGDPRSHARPAAIMTPGMRTATTRRDTRETQISARVDIDGTGVAAITLPLPFFKHMIEAFTKYSGMDVTLDGRR